MIGMWFNSLWHFVASSASLATLIGCGAVAVAVLEPVWMGKLVPNLRWAAIYVALAAFSYTSVAGKFYNDGLSVKQAQWDKSLGRETTDGEQILRDAVRDAASDTPDSLRNDRWNRDNWKDGRRP